jgi:serine/threonine protein kinase
MLGKDEICKVGDFGLLRKMNRSKKTDTIYYAATKDTPIPIRWMAPESLDVNKKQFSTASDVWSFGVVQWEMMNPKGKPYKVT